MMDIRNEIVEKVFCHKNDDKIKMPVQLQIVLQIYKVNWSKC